MPRRHRTQADHAADLASVAAKFNNGKGKALHDLAYEYRTNRATIRRWLAEAGVRTAAPTFIGLADDELTQAIASRWNAGTPIRKINLETGLAEARVHELLAEAGMNTRVHWERRNLPEKEVVDRFNAGESIRALGRRYRCGHLLIAHVLDDHDVQRPGLVQRRQRQNESP